MKKILLTLMLLVVCGTFVQAAPYIHSYNPPGPSIENPNSALNGFQIDALAGNETPVVLSDDLRLNDDNPPPAATPEPATLILFGMGLAGAYGARKMRREK